jgi:hypothetical protein
MSNKSIIVLIHHRHRFLIYFRCSLKYYIYIYVCVCVCVCAREFMFLLSLVVHSVIGFPQTQKTDSFILQGDRDQEIIKAMIRCIVHENI